MTGREPAAEQTRSHGHVAKGAVQDKGHPGRRRLWGVGRGLSWTRCSSRPPALPTSRDTSLVFVACM